MSVPIREIHRIAALARLRLEQGEAERMARDVGTILDHMAVLGRTELQPAPRAGAAVDAESAQSGGDDPREVAASTLERVTAPDPLAEPLSRLAPDWREGFFVVPRLPGVAGAPDESGDSS